jgi:hypothetical protein
VNEVRRRGGIWVGIVVVVVFFACVTFAVASLGGGPGIPHSVGGDQAACTACHPVDRLSGSHRDRTIDGCRSCHSPAPPD